MRWPWSKRAEPTPEVVLWTVDQEALTALRAELDHLLAQLADKRVADIAALPKPDWTYRIVRREGASGVPNNTPPVVAGWYVQGWKVAGWGYDGREGYPIHRAYLGSEERPLRATLKRLGDRLDPKSGQAAYAYINEYYVTLSAFASPQKAKAWLALWLDPAKGAIPLDETGKEIS